MSAKRKKHQPKAFESHGQSWDTSANIYHSMQMSDAWKDLSPQQKVLYLACKDQMYSTKPPIEDDRTSFTMSRHQWMRQYNLYGEGNQGGFYRDMKALIGHGFIELVYSGKFTREKSVYRYSSKWRTWKPSTAPTPEGLQRQRETKGEKGPAPGDI